MPVALTISDASSPDATAWLLGCVVIFGAVEPGGGSAGAGGSVGFDGDGGAGVPGAGVDCPVSVEVGLAGLSPEQADAIAASMSRTTSPPRTRDMCVMQRPRGEIQLACHASEGGLRAIRRAAVAILMR